ncbi:MAG: transcription termination/antitermination protein NusA [Candidatus Omnitrophica bacterium]|nr:transcription termination/antitermination protein NusA [Candidatus Omnitrophota bacterium]
MDGELLLLIDAIVREKGIDREVLIQAIESALASAAKKGTGGEGKEVSVTIDRQRGHLTVVSDGKQLPSAEFSRIGAQTAKQVIMQKIREAERDVIFGEFHDKAGTIVSGTVHRFERGDIIVDLGRAEGILPKSERIPYEDYRQGDRIQAYLLEVRKGAKGAEVVLSRAHEGFIRGLFALEVPEIADGTVEIKAIAREPGERTKIAVASTDEKVDSQGACIGMRGTRVKNIVRELRGERVDIIRWHEDTAEYIMAALAPAKIAEIQAHPESQQALVIVDDDQLSLAIGKKGQNVRLASKLAGWQLEIKSRSQISMPATALRNVRGVGPAMEERLREGGITSVEQLAGSTVEQLTAIKGVGEKTAEKLIEAAKETLAAAAQASVPAGPTAVESEVPAQASGPSEPTAQSMPTEESGESPPSPTAQSGQEGDQPADQS